MPRTKTRVCDVTGMKTSEKNFYANQSHVKAVDIYVDLAVQQKIN